MPTARAYSTLALFFICATTAAKIEGSRKQRVAPRQVARAADTKLSEVVDLDVGEMDSSGRRGHRSTIRRYKRRGRAPFMGSLSTIGQFSFQGNHEEEDVQAESLGEASLGRAVSAELATAKRFSPHGAATIRRICTNVYRKTCPNKAGPSKGPRQELPDFSPSAMQRIGRNHKVNTAFISKFRHGLSRRASRDKRYFDRKKHIITRACATALLKPLYYDGKNGKRGKRNLHRICTSCRKGYVLRPTFWREKAGFCRSVKNNLQMRCFQLNTMAYRRANFASPQDKDKICIKYGIITDSFNSGLLPPESEAYRHFKHVVGHYDTSVARCELVKYTVCRGRHCAVRKMGKCVEVCKTKGYTGSKWKYKNCSSKLCKKPFGTMACQQILMMA